METSTERGPLIVVRDPRIRAWLIAAAEAAELLILSEKISERTQLRTLTPIGMEISITWKRRTETLTIFQFHFHLNLLALEQWCRANTWMLEDTLLLTIKGIDVCLPEGPNPWNRVGFSIRAGEGHAMKEVWVRIEKKDVTFIVHREVTQQREWEIFLEE